MTITVYSKPSCVQCTATYRALDRAGLSYDVVDLSADERALAQVMELGYQQAPVVFAPSMNVHMWENPITQENVARLKTFGRRFIEPDSGELACGYEGKGRLPDPEAIMKELQKFL